MKNKSKTDLKIFPMMIAKSLRSLKPGAYTGESFNAKSIDEMFEQRIEIPRS
jgi:hypothetical protein